MPKGDGTGPPSSTAQRGGQMGGAHTIVGPGGICVCPSCGARFAHERRIPCYDLSCPECGTKMVRG